MIKVAFLFDKKNDWISNYVPESIFKLESFKFYFFFDPTKIKSFEIVFVLGYTKILDESFINNNKNTFLVHESDLPLGKGFSPVQWQILEGKNKIKVSLVELSKQLDSGDIIKQMDMVFNGSELYQEIRLIQANVTFKLIESFLKTYPNFKKKPQSGKSTFYRRRKPYDSELDINQTLKNQFPLLRIGNNEKWPSFFRLKGNTYIIKIFKKDQKNGC